MPLRGPVSVTAYKKSTAEIVQIGPMTGYIYEDGSHTDTRVGCATLEIPPGVKGPPMHWHRFHDELFFIVKGECVRACRRVTFQTRAIAIFTSSQGKWCS